MYDAYRPPPPPPPPIKKPFWTRPKVGAAGLFLGLMIGVAGTGDAEPDDGGSAAKSDVPTQALRQGPTDEEVRQQVDEAVASATGDLEAELASTQDALAAQEKKAAADLRALRSRAKKAQAAAVDEAVTQALADVPDVDVPEEEPVVDPAPSTDPDFGTCADAKDAGYGPYYAGQDPEYDWYTDRDSDGVVCE